MMEVVARSSFLSSGLAGIDTSSLDSFEEEVHQYFIQIHTPVSDPNIMDWGEGKRQRPISRSAKGHSCDLLA